MVGTPMRSAVPILRSQVSSGEDRLLRCAQGFLWIASNARSGPIPLPPGGGVVWEEGQAFSLWIWVRWVSGFLVVGCAVVLAMGWDAVGGSAGSVLRSQGSSGEDQLLRCAQGFCGSLPMLAPDRSRCRLLGSAYEPDAEAAWPEAFPGSAS